MDLQKEVLDPLCPLANSADWQIKGVFLQTLSKDSKYQALIQMISLIKVALAPEPSLALEDWFSRESTALCLPPMAMTSRN
ncbi:hypothetical protein PAXINDRAFT_18551 [Paxillus involutus ATCC 200175]|uniref:Uncharacterized protein n=1 Tax=Paxillus involutus ATCC 200175 TaxID=664439 RepID=A0A0C9TB79_PAXIN|nr:hypothetical protein PAXINDRAFT_18551 [Paxillus involutus ATCC 200175]